MPDDHEFYSMPPCDNSDASKITAKDKSRSSVRHNSLQFNTNLRRHMAEFIPGFGDDEYTNSSTIKYSWCWNSKDRVGIFCFDSLKSLKLEFQIINSNQRVSKLSRDGSRGLTRSGIIFQESSRWPCWPCALFHRKCKWNLLDSCRR